MLVSPPGFDSFAPTAVLIIAFPSLLYHPFLKYVYPFLLPVYWVQTLRNEFQSRLLSFCSLILFIWSEVNYNFNGSEYFFGRGYYA